MPTQASKAVCYCLRLVYIGNVFKAKMPAAATHDSQYCTCPGHLGRHDKK
jgi:hypothetical protein